MMLGSVTSGVAYVLVALVALMHLWFMALEMALWTKPLGRKAFRLTPEFAQATARLAANQGLYNGFLAAGLIWGLVLGGDAQALAVKTFFLTCVVVAGLYGGWSVNRRIAPIQAGPAALALAACHLAALG